MEMQDNKNTIKTSPDEILRNTLIQYVQELHAEVTNAAEKEIPDG